MQTAISSETARKSWDRLPLAIFGLGLLTSLSMIAFGWRVQRLVSSAPDPYGFAEMAHDLLAGKGFAGCGSVLNRRGPGYPALIALVYLVTGEHPVMLQLVQALMLATVSLLAFDIGRRLYNRRTGIIAGVLCAFHPALLRYVPDFHLETALTFVTTLAIWRSVILLEKPSWKNGALFGVFAGVATLIKPVVVLYPALFAAWWIVGENGKGLRRAEHPSKLTSGLKERFTARWVAAAALAAAMSVVILPWTYRNYRVSGHPVLVTTGVGDAFLRGYIFSQTDFILLRRPPYTDAENESNATFRELCRQAGTEWTRDDIETEKILSSAAKAKLLADPVGFLRKLCVQMFTFWYQMTSLANSLVIGAAALVAWVFALIGWRRARAEGYLSWPLLLPILYLNVFLAALLALGRYSVPVLPELIVLAAFGVDTVLSRRLSVAGSGTPARSS